MRPRDLLSCDPAKTAVARVSDQRPRPGEGRSAHSGANFASVAPKRAHRSTRRHQNRRRGMRGSHPGTILSERAAAPVATVAYNRRCRRCLVDGPVFIPGDHRLHDCSAQQAKCDVIPGERSPLARGTWPELARFHETQVDESASVRLCCAIINIRPRHHTRGMSPDPLLPGSNTLRAYSS